MTIDQIKQYRKGLSEIYETGKKHKYYTMQIKTGSYYHGGEKISDKTKPIGEQETALTEEEKFIIFGELERLDYLISLFDKIDKA